MTTDSDDPQIRLRDLIALAGNDLSALRASIEQLHRRDADAVLLIALVRIASLPDFDAAEAESADDERAEDVEELPADPFADPAYPYAAALDGARQLRKALVGQDDLSGMLAAFSALSDAECVAICFELALARLWERKLGDGADAE